MRIGPLNIPEDVLAALDEGKLVVFAGAGVSQAAPSRLQGFNTLVEQILERQLSEQEATSGQLDRLLGRELEQGRAVHQRAHQLLSERLSQANNTHSIVHQSLVQLLAGRDAVRIVTTNFDPLFERAIEAETLDSPVRIFTAPALPLGSDFSGVVYLHGSLQQGPASLVLTDADFGRAYLTEGWARRFILELFRTFTVLFVGYKHDDTVMRYLARGLSPAYGRQRYALTAREEQQEWKFLGIEPIEYTRGKDHEELCKGLQEWAVLERRGALDWDGRIRELVQSGPGLLSPSDERELEFVFHRTRLAHLFFRYATAPEWLEWAHSKNVFARLFDPRANEDDLRDLALWFSDDPLGVRGRVALRIALDQPRTINRTLAASVEHKVLVQLANGGVPDGREGRQLARWAAVLLERSARSPSPPLVDGWLHELRADLQPELAIQLFSSLLRTTRNFQDPFASSSSSEHAPYARSSVHEGAIRLAWGSLRLHLGKVAHLLVPTLTEALEERWRWEVALNGARPALDPWSHERDLVRSPQAVSSLGDHPDDRRVILLDIGKELLDWLLSEDRELGNVTIRLWLRSTAPQLIQLGLYGLAESEDWTPLQKLRLLESRYLPVDFPFKAEAFQVLQTAYAAVNEDHRRSFLRRAKGCYLADLPKLPEENDKRQSIAYEWFNLLTWLQRAVPEDPLLKPEIEEIRAAYPWFEPSDHPELDIEEIDGPKAEPVAFSSADLLKMSPAEWLDQRENLPPRPTNIEWPSSATEDFFSASREASRTDYPWGMRVARLLLETKRWTDRIWPQLVAAWTERSLTEAEFLEVLRLLSSEDLLKAHTSSIASFLRDQPKKEAATPAAIISALPLVEVLLTFAEKKALRIVVRKTQTQDWLRQAINHPGGYLAEFCIRACGVLAGAEPTPGVPAPLKPLLERMVSGKGTASVLARVVLASRTLYFWNLDPDWAGHSLIPLFDWSTDALRAEQAWHGFFYSRGPNASLMAALAPTFEEVSLHLHQLGETRKRYGAFVARAAFHDPAQPHQRPWFRALFRHGEDVDKAQFAWELGEILKLLDGPRRGELWTGWVGSFLRERAEQLPQPAALEFTAILDWCFSLQGHLTEFVGLLEHLPVSPVKDSMLLHRLADGGLKNNQADSVAKLILVALRGWEDFPSWNLGDLRNCIEDLRERGLTRPLQEKLVEKFLELGGSDPPALQP